MLSNLNTFSPQDDSIYSSFTVALLSNGLNITGVLYYFFLMFRGYGILPFIKKPQKLLMATLPIVGTLLTMTVFGINSWNLLLKFTVI